MSGNASVTGSGVTIVNAGGKFPSSGGTFGAISFSGNGSTNLSPATTGTYAGIVIFQPPDNSQALTASGDAGRASPARSTPRLPVSHKATMPRSA